jgi:magnesium-transporting ATPase (P-type)
VFDPFFISTYNMIYTAAPVLMLGSLEQDVGPRTAVRYPRLYEPGLARLWFSRHQFAQFAIHGLVTSLMLIGVIMGNSSQPAHALSCVFVFIFSLACRLHFEFISSLCQNSFLFVHRIVTFMLC